MSICTLTFTGFASNPEVKDFGGKAVTVVSVAYSKNRRTADGEWESNTNWYSCEVQGAMGARIADQIQKGDYVLVTGELEQKTAKSGKSYSNVYVNKIEVLRRKGTPPESSESSESSDPGF